MSERGTSRCYSHDPETNHLRVYIRRRTRVRSWPRAKIARWQRWGNDSASGTPYRFVNTPRGYAPGEKPVAWASLTSRSKSLEDDGKCLSVTTSFLPTDRDFLFRALFSFSLSRSLKLKLTHRQKATLSIIGQSSLQSSGLFITSIRLFINAYLSRNYQKYQ